MELTKPLEYRFEFEPFEDDYDEASVNLRAYLDRVPDDKLAAYRPDMTDEEVILWDGNFTDEGNLFLVCCDREVEVDEFRREVEAAIRYRARLRQ